MIALAILGATLFIQREREVFQRGAADRIRALVTALDAELNGHIEALTTLSSSVHLEKDNLRAFHEDALRVLKSQPDWFNIHLALPSGRQVVNALRPFGLPLNDVAERPSFDRVLQTKQRVVGDMVRGPLSGLYQFAVRVPVLRNGTVRYVVSAVIKTEVVDRLLSPQQLRHDWVGGVLDRNNRIVARTLAPKESVGQLASDSLRAARTRAPEGWFRGSTREGQEVYASYSHSQFSGWVVALGIPATAVEAAERATIWIAMTGIATATLLALLLALAMSSRLSAPIVFLASAARTMGHGERPYLSGDSEIEEIGYLAKALEDAATATRAREETQGRLAAIVDSSRDAIISYSLDGIVLTWNHGAEQLFGYSVEESRGRHISFIVPPERASEREQVFSAVSRGESRELETIRVKKNGSRVEVALSLSPIRNASGEVVGISAAMRDITARRRAAERLRETAEALREADRRKDEFIATLSHELRNPLGPIRNAVRILKTPNCPEATLNWCRDVIDQQVAYMARLLEDLLDVSRITRDKLELRKEIVALDAIIRNAVEISRPFIEENAHTIAVDLPAEPVCVDGDPARLTQVFVNLLNNAAKYMERGGHIGVSARLASSSETCGAPAEEAVPDKEVMVSIKDSGIGIPADLLPHIFEVFFQADSSIERRQGGLGIGLTLARSLIELHGGRVEAKSAGAGKGSEFIVRLPLARDGLSDNLAQNTAPPIKPAGHVRRVLVIEDGIAQAKTLAMLLEVMGCRTRVARDGMSALAVAEEFLPDLALIDIGLPGLTGYEVARRMRLIKGLENIVLIAQTGWGREEDREQSWHAGFDYHLTKPIDHQLLEKILMETALPELNRTGEKSREFYKDYIVTSRATYDAASKSWMPVVALSWRQGRDFHLHKLNASRTFDVEAEAIAEGFVMGRHWVDQQL
jgi:PAS domain S-box-containing protein